MGVKSLCCFLGNARGGTALRGNCGGPLGTANSGGTCAETTWDKTPGQRAAKREKRKKGVERKGQIKKTGQSLKPNRVAGENG